MKLTRAAVMMLLAAVAALVFINPAAATPSTPIVDRAGQHLRQDPVWIDPAAAVQLTSVQVESLRAQIRKGPHPVFVAIVPLAVKNEVPDEDRLMGSVAAKTGLPGVYAVWADVMAFRGGAYDADDLKDAAEQATLAYRNHKREGVYAVLMDFVTRVQTLHPTANNSAARQPAVAQPPTPLYHNAVFMTFVALVVVATFGFLGWSVHRARKAKRELARRKRSLERELQAISSRLSDKVLYDRDSGSDLTKVADLREDLERAKLDDLPELYQRVGELQIKHQMTM